MSIWNKVLLVLLLITGTVYLWLGSQRYLLQKAWEAKIAKTENTLLKVQKEVASLHNEVYGNPFEKEDTWEQMSLQTKLNKVRSLIQGAIWCQCRPHDELTNKAGEIKTSFDLPPDYNPAGVAQESLLYIFDSGAPIVEKKKQGENAEGTVVDQAQAQAETVPEDQSDNKVASIVADLAPATFLGIFRVTSVNRTQVNIVSVVNFSQNETAALERSIKSKKGWTICVNRLPIDSPNDFVVWNQLNPGIMATLSEEDKEYFNKREFSPEELSSLDAASLGAKDAKSRVPVDYGFVLEHYFSRRDTIKTFIARKEVALQDTQIVLADQLVSMGTDLSGDIMELVDTALFDRIKEANKVETWLAKQERLKEASASMKKEEALVKSKLDQANEVVAEMQVKLDELIKENCVIAAKIAKAQFEAATRIQKSTDKATASLEDSTQILRQTNFGI